MAATSRHSEIRALTEVASNELSEIRSRYENSLKAQTVNPELSIKIKSFLENLRSALDYLVAEVSESVLGLSAKRKLYFPMDCRDLNDFRARMQKSLPSIDLNSPDIFRALEEVQAYNPAGCKSLPKLNQLVNENKHRRFSPQTRKEFRSLKMDFGSGCSVSLGPGCSISGSGVISSGSNVVILRGDTISPSTPARVGHGVQQTVEAWVSFRFDETGDDVLELLNACLKDTRRVVNSILLLL